MAQAPKIISPEMKTLQKKADEPGQKGQDGVSRDEFDKLLGMVGGLTEALVKNQAQTAESHSQLLAQIAEGQKPQPEPVKQTDPNDFTGFDLEAMGREDYTKFILGRTGAIVEASLQKIIGDRLDGLEQSGQRMRSQVNLDKAVAAHSDFMDWDQEIAAVAKRQPGISAEDAYVLAKGSNPEKAKVLQAAVDEKKKADDLKEAPPFGGLYPTRQPAREARQDMKPQEAAQKAWEEVVIPLGEEAVKELTGEGVQ